MISARRFSADATCSTPNVAGRWAVVTCAHLSTSPASRAPGSVQAAVAVVEIAALFAPVPSFTRGFFIRIAKVFNTVFTIYRRAAPFANALHSRTLGFLRTYWWFGCTPCSRICVTGIFTGLLCNIRYTRYTSRGFCMMRSTSNTAIRYCRILRRTIFTLSASRCW